MLVDLGVPHFYYRMAAHHWVAHLQNLTGRDNLMETKVIILRTPLTESALSVIFGYRARAYYLDQYAQTNTTFPERLLKLYLNELNRCLKRTG